MGNGQGGQFRSASERAQRRRRTSRRLILTAVLALVPSLVAVEGAAAAAPTCQALGVVPAPPGGSMMISLNCSDADGDPLTLSATDPDHGTLSAITVHDLVTYSPDAGYTGMDEFTYRANDGTSDSSDVAVVINVRPLGIGDTCNGNLITIYGLGKIRGTPGNDVMASLQSVPDYINAGAGDDTVCSGNENDRVHVGPGNDLANGGAGDDLLNGGPGSDDLLGSIGTNTVTYRSLAGPVVVDLVAGSDSDGGTLTDIHNVVGTEGADHVTGTSGANEFRGWGGNDTFVGGPGPDHFVGGPGTHDAMHYTERLAGEPVTVTLADGATNDGGALDGLAGSRDELGGSVEDVSGGAGDDAISGNGAANVLVGGLGADSLFGFGGVDLLQANDGVADIVIDCGGRVDQPALFDAGLDPAPISC